MHYEVYPGLVPMDTLFIHGNLEIAVASLQSVYDSIPASEEVVRQCAHEVLIQAKRCERRSRT